MVSVTARLAARLRLSRCAAVCGREGWRAGGGRRSCVATCQGSNRHHAPAGQVGHVDCSTPVQRRHPRTCVSSKLQAGGHSDQRWRRRRVLTEVVA